MKILTILILITSTAWAQEKGNFSKAVKEDIRTEKPSKSSTSKYEYKEHEGRFPASVLQERMEERPKDRPEPNKLDKNFRQVTPERW